MYLEIAYHPEPRIDKSGKPVWHYHTYGPELKHDNVHALTAGVAEKHMVYLKEVGYGTSRT